MPRTCHRVAAHGRDVEYASCAGTAYLSLGYHRGRTTTAREKTLWIIPRADECHVFCSTEAPGSTDMNGDAWAISKDAARVFGENGERFAFFAKPVNAPTDPWHGYPVSGRKKAVTRRRPPDDVVAHWLQSGWISFTTHERILGGRL